MIDRDEKIELLARIGALEAALTMALGLLARDPDWRQQMLDYKKGYLVQLAQSGRPTPSRPHQEQLATALHDALAGLFEKVPREL